MRRCALPLLVLVACASPPRAGEHVVTAPQAFASEQAVPLDFEIDGRLNADSQDPATLRTLIKAQLLFTIGPLNAERSVGRLGLLDVSDVHATEVVVTPEPADGDAGAPSPPPPPRYDVTYHAKLPVAWAGSTIPTSYTFTLPARLGAADQTAFAAKYGAKCVDPAEGPAEAGHMFVIYRPRQSGCELAADDVVTFTANVTPSAELTRGKYPEYHRVWKDEALNVVALFTHEYAKPTEGDEGALAYDDFVWRMREYIRLLQPDARKRSEPKLSQAPSAAGISTLRLAAELPDGRSMKLDVRLVGTALGEEGPAFDEWYDGVTPAADIILFNGHAGLGDNVRALMNKGAFRSGQYLIWFANGCDTIAYVDHTLAERRASLNPDDPNGTKYLDTVTNVMAGYFSELEATGTTFLRAFVEVRYPEIGPKTYEEIFKQIDPEQVAVVTGEEDNELEPLPPSRFPPGPPPGALVPKPAEPEPAEPEPESDPTADAPPPVQAKGSRARDGGCGVSPSRDAGFELAALGALFIALAARQRSRRSTAR
ncbi:MAG: hypothetical protein KF764_19045 [Labilithrix sp.]|nr:hypothetical protein [Labilithrix sp.]